MGYPRSRLVKRLRGFDLGIEPTSTSRVRLRAGGQDHSATQALPDLSCRKMALQFHPDATHHRFTTGGLRLTVLAMCAKVNGFGASRYSWANVAVFYKTTCSFLEVGA